MFPVEYFYKNSKRQSAQPSWGRESKQAKQERRIETTNQAWKYQNLQIAQILPLPYPEFSSHLCVVYQDGSRFFLELNEVQESVGSKAKSDSRHGYYRDSLLTPFKFKTTGWEDSSIAPPGVESDPQVDQKMVELEPMPKKIQLSSAKGKEESLCRVFIDDDSIFITSKQIGRHYAGDQSGVSALFNLQYGAKFKHDYAQNLSGAPNP